MSIIIGECLSRSFCSGLVSLKVSSTHGMSSLNCPSYSSQKVMHIKYKQYLMNAISKFNPLSANPTKWSNILKQFVGNS